MESLQSVMKQAGAQRFNFLTLMSGLQESNPPGTLSSLVEQFRDAALTFNFQGDVEGAALSSALEDQDAAQKELFGMKRIHFVANQVGPRLNITLYLPYREEKKVLTGIFETGLDLLQKYSGAWNDAGKRMIMGKQNVSN